MKKSLLSTMFIVGMTVAASAQDRERRVGLDDFGTARGVKIVTLKPVSKSVPVMPKTASKNGSVASAQVKMDKKGEIKLVRKTASVRAVSYQSPVNSRTVSYQSPVNSMDLAEYTPTVSTPKVAVKTGGGALGGFSTGDTTVDSYILGACARHNVDPLLIYAQMHQESAFKKRAMSHKGARGLMQLMPATAIRFGVTDIYDPEQNIYAGVKYMRWLLNKFDQDINLALAGYNAGEGAVMKYGNEIPPYNETREYVRRISNRYALLRDPNAVRRAVTPIVNPQIAQAKKTTPNAKVSVVSTASLQKSSKPLSIYERSVSVVKSTNGTMQLVSQ